MASQRFYTTSLSGPFSDSLGGESCGQWPGHGSRRACRGCPFQRTSKLTVTRAMRGRAWQVSTKPVSIYCCPSVNFLAMATLPCGARAAGAAHAAPAGVGEVQIGGQRDVQHLVLRAHGHGVSFAIQHHLQRKNSVVWGFSPRGYYINSYISCSYLWCLGS